MASLLPQRAHIRELVLSPQEHLVAGGPAEQLEQHIQTAFRAGTGKVIVDLRAVPVVDSAGIRALVRGHTTAQRLGREFCIITPNLRVRETLQLARLDSFFTEYDTLASARARSFPWRQAWVAVGVVTVGTGLVFAGYLIPSGPLTTDYTDPLSQMVGARERSWESPLYELAKLIVAAVVGMLVTLVQRHYRTDKTPDPTLEQAQVLLCVSGALMMIIIAGSLARAFGIAGAASIIRFRTPVEDARDITVLFLLMGLGMAAGLGGFAVAGLGTLFLCGMFPVLSFFASESPRTMMVEIEALDRDFPIDHVQKVFAVNDVIFELREVSQGQKPTVCYLTTLRPQVSLEDLSAQLMDGGRTGIKNVSWSPPKRF